MKPGTTPKVPLIVDLDGTLVKTDTLYESVLAFVVSSPQRIFEIFGRLIKYQKSGFKKFISENQTLEFTDLPINLELLETLKNEKQTGRNVFLATGANKKIAKGFCDSFELFDGYFASDKNLNLIGSEKANLLVKKFGPKNFDYIGNSKEDLIVIEKARQGFLVNTSQATARRAKHLDNLEIISYAEKPKLIKVLRMHQWVKNILIFLPALAAINQIAPLNFLAGLWAFLCFSLCSSSLYVLNDLIDLPHDRKSSTKRHRQLASGVLSIPAALCISFCLILFWVMLSIYMFSPLVLNVLIGYFLLSNLYSLTLKRIIIVDVFLLTSFYLFRIVIGIIVFEIPGSFWLFGFTSCVFLSLGFLKRFAELNELKTDDVVVAGRAYKRSDKSTIQTFGISSAFLAIIVLMFYLNELPFTLSSDHAGLMWLCCPVLLFWLIRTWFLANRGQVSSDPIEFLIRDKFSYFLFFALASLYAYVFLIA